MRSIFKILIIVISLGVIGCTDNTWDDHYNKQPETINKNVWDAMKEKPELSKFVELLVKYKYDTLFQRSDAFTIFAPDNSAIDKLGKNIVIDKTILNYHISRHFLNPVDIQGKRKLQTLDEKYSTFENANGKPTYDGIVLKSESPLYLNGKFFVMGDVTLPKPNLYQFFAINNPILKNYIDKEDSIIIDKERSRPIGFDDKGNTVYDTVSIKVNLFELKYFPVSKELRNFTATFVYPKQATYDKGLTEMALKIGGKYTSAKDIPVKWQEDVLIPHLVKHGTFLNMLEPSEFKTIDVLTKKKKFNMVNIAGDSIVVNYLPTDPSLCSNGISYDYANFVIPDSLYSGAEKYEGEWLARATGANKYAWKKNVTVSSTTFFDVALNSIKGASNDSILTVNFTKGYKGTYKLQFLGKNLFPRKYRCEVHTHMDIGGIYDIYINDVLVKTFDYYDFIRSKGLIKSVAGNTFVPTGRYNRFDFYVDNITEFGKPNIRFEYKGPSLAPNNGLAIDVIKFLPVIE